MRNKLDLKNRSLTSRTDDELGSFRQIFNSIAIIGGSSFVDILLRIVRTKILAVILGPGGMGICGFYNSILMTATAFGGCGLSLSGVRQIAEAEAAHEEDRLAVTHRALTIATIFLAVL
jgi:PST family polysaccharide transporter